MFNREKLIKIMKSKDISMYRLWKLSGVSQSTISDIINKKGKNPTTKTLQRIADALDVAINDLFDQDDIKESEPEINIPQEYSDKYKVTKKDIKQHDEVLEHAQAFMMDDKVGEDDKEKLVAVINKLYWDSKAKNKEKFGKKKKKE